MTSGVSANQLPVRIVGEDEARTLNHDWRRKDYATNVLTFDYERAPVVMTDLVLCAPVIAREAAAQGTPLEAHYAHLLVHRALHAQGLDHLRAGPPTIGHREAEAYGQAVRRQLLEAPFISLRERFAPSSSQCAFEAAPCSPQHPCPPSVPAWPTGREP